MARQKRAYAQKQQRYIDLKNNGRLFPSWVLANFRDFRLPEIMRKEGEDPCQLRADGKVELHKYQRFFATYLDYRSPYRDILVYHGVGSGKTASAINIYNMLYNYTPGWNVFILIKASLRDHPWMTDIKKWLTKDEYDFRFKNIIFVHYDSPFADRDFLNAVKNADSSKKSMYIIDEVHNFIRNVYSNISSRAGRRALVIYDYIIQDKQENNETRVVTISATPAINEPYELALLFNLLRPGSFPKSENEFNQMYISDSAYKTINKKTKNMFQRRIAGLVSYYYGATADRYAAQKTHYIDIEMSEYQEEIYRFFESIEEKVAKAGRGKKRAGSMYKSYTRQACNFVFPALSQKVTGENRPRPNKFRMNEKEAQKLMEGKTGEKLKAETGDRFLNTSLYMKALLQYTQEMDAYLKEAAEADQKAKHTFYDDFNVYKSKYQGDFNRFIKEHKKKSKLLAAMSHSSNKFVMIIFNILLSKGPVLVYSNYVMMEGFEVFKLYLRSIGFRHAVNEEGPDNGLGYVEFHGGIEREDRKKALKLYNDKGNIAGKKAKIIMISPAGSEGISLRNCRQVHITEPYWHETRIIQMIGRAIRQCSHSDLPMEERKVDVFRYKSVRTKTTKWTADQQLEDHARGKEGLIQSFLDTLKEAAIDCVLYQAHNMVTQQYRCFQFEEPSLFDRQIGPAYKEDFIDDLKIDNGSNSMNSMTIKIKVMEISAVILTNPDPEKPTYTEAKKYWYYDQSGVVYDHELKFPVGKVAVDDRGIPFKKDKETYIIDRVIPIPMLSDRPKK